MQNSKLYSILSHFNKYEQNRFRKYLCSPYFNVNERLIKLFDLLAEDLNGHGNGFLEKESVWADLYEQEAYDDVRFRKHFSDLLKLVEGFLTQQIYDENPLQKATFLIGAVSKKKMEKLYNSTVRTARRLSNQQPHRSADFFYFQYKIEKDYYDLSQFDRKRSDVSNIEAIANNLDSFYLAEKLRIYCNILSRQYMVSHEYETLFIEEILSHIEKYNYDSVPPVAIYYQIYLALTESENPERYFRLRDLLDKHGLEFPKDEAFDLYTFAINYCVRQINKGNQEFLREYFMVYRDLLNKEIVIVDGELPPAHFRNIVIVGLRLGEIEWTEQFIHRYKNYLPEPHRANAVTFNLAQLYFYKKEYDKVIEMLQFVEYEDLTYNLNSKTFLLMTYYETDEVEPLFSLLESFRAYLNRHKKIAVRRRRSFLLLIKFVKKLTRILPGDTKELDKLQSELDAAKGVASIKWIKEKMEELA